MKTKITVIIPTYNREQLIGETLTSVSEQTYQNWECIIVDDGSGDGTQETVESYVKKDSRFRFYKRHRPPKNANTCRNIGIDKAQGQFLMFLDSDDLLLPHTLEERLNLIESDKTDFILRFSYRYSEGKKVKRRVPPPTNTETVRKEFLKGNWHFNTPSLFIRKQSIQKVGAFDEKLDRMQDPDLYLRLFEYQTKLRFTAYDIPDVLVRKATESNRSKGLSDLSFYSFAYFVDKHLRRLQKRPHELKYFMSTVRIFLSLYISVQRPSAILVRKKRLALIRIICNTGLTLGQRIFFALAIFSFVLIPNRIGYRIAHYINNHTFKPSTP